MGGDSRSSLATAVVVLLLLPPLAAAVNITELLADEPELSEFNRLLSSTGVAADIAGRSSVTLLAVPNSVMARSVGRPVSDMADVLRYHVLLQYLSRQSLCGLPPSGELVTTLFQTTGRAPANLGTLNVTRSPSSCAVSVRSPGPAPSNATVLSFVLSVPYNLSVFTVDALLAPSGFDLAASENRPAPLLNITRVLVDGRDFNVAAAMLEASGVVEEFEDREHGAGITLFAPTDEAFAALPAATRFQSLPADRKATVLRFHLLNSYYPLGSLESIVNPVEPTLASEKADRAGLFTLNITRANGSVAIDTGVVQASITRTVFDQNPVAVFAVSSVLLPRELFGSGFDASEVAPPPAIDDSALSPEYSPPTRLSAPPDLKRDTTTSAAAAAAVHRSCIIFISMYLFL